MRKLQWLAVFSIFFVCPALFADQVTLKNGDRFTGTIVKSDDKTLLIKTEFAGDVTVQWTAIQGISSTQPLHVSLTDGQVVAGPVTTTDGSLAVATGSKGTVTTPITAVNLIRSDAEQAAFEKSLHPSLFESWAGGLNVGFALTRGNSASKNLALAFTADRKTLHDHIGIYANTVYATNDAEGADPSTTANAIWGGIRYDRNLTPRVFAFVNGDFQHDGLQDLDIRSVTGGGIGFHAINSERTTLDLLAGVNYTHESYSTFSRNFAAGTFGEELSHKFGTSTVLTQKLYFYPDFNNLGEYRGVFAFGTVTKINKWLGWQNSFGDTYVTNPPPGTKQNDLIFTTGLNVSFTH